MSERDIASIRTDYKQSVLDEATVGKHPIPFFIQWFEEACAAEITEANAMTLATSDAQGHPHARIVLLKGIDEGKLVFFTNYESAKGYQLDETPYAALVFFWKELERQVRIEGIVHKITPEASKAYFDSRPVGSRIGACASPQSKEIENRDILDENYARFSEVFEKTGNIMMPPNWGGYALTPHQVEFWQGRSNRLHDRIVFELQDGQWAKKRLAP